MTDNEWARRGRERKALALEHALNAAGVTSTDALDRYVLTDDRIRNIAERAAADELGHVWRKPASDCGPGQHTDPDGRCCTWGFVRHLFQQVDASRALLAPTTTED